MGGITTGIGIFSGINTADLIDQLLAIDARPRALIQFRIVTLQQQKAAFLDINTAMLALKNAASSFRTSDTFNAARATSSDSEVLAATAGPTATPASYSFIVDRLVTTQQHLSRGFADADSAGLGASSFTFESGGGFLAIDSKLSDLNGGEGVQRGKIQITDKDGGSATIDLSTAVTIRDVLDAINSFGAIQVTATIDGDALTINDNSGGSGALSITNTFGSSTATSLGIEATLSSGPSNGITLNGVAIRTISGLTALSTLNDENGVLVGAASVVGAETPDFTITTRDGVSHGIFLGELTTTTPDPETGEDITTVVQNRASTLQDVIDIIESRTGGAVSVTLSADATGLVLTDTTAGAGAFAVIEGGNSRTTATDLGIIADVGAGDTINGQRLIASLNSTLARNLNGGVGLTSGAMTITDRSGAIAAITITSADLAGSVEDLIQAINTKLGATVAVIAQVNEAGNGIMLMDTSGGTSDLTASGSFADQLELSGSAASNELQGGSAQLRWVSRATRLDSLNAGQGIGTGTIRVVTASGQTTTIDIAENQKSVDDLVRLMNGAAVGFTASINAQGDGILITDDSGGSGTLRIEDVSGTVARKLNLAGEAADTESFIDGSFERTVVFDAGDTLEDVSRKINEAGVAITAAVINDGGGASPFRLSLTARNSGAAGRTIIDTDGFDLGLSFLSRGDDAVVFFGGSDPASGVLLTTSTNTLDNVVRGVSIDLRSTSSQSVVVVVSRDLETIELTIEGFVESFNDALSKLDQHDRFDAETETRGVLFGDGTVATLRNALRNAIQGQPQGLGGAFTRLFQVGVRIGSGGELEFDSEKFRQAYETDPEGVADLFAARDLVPREEFTELEDGVSVRNVASEDTFNALGIVQVIAELMERYTDSIDGRLIVKDHDLDDLIDLQVDRVGQLSLRLEGRRQKLERQFLAMEQAIAQLQTQSQALQLLG